MKTYNISCIYFFIGFEYYERLSEDSYPSPLQYILQKVFSKKYTNTYTTYIAIMRIYGKWNLNIIKHKIGKGTQRRAEYIEILTVGWKMQLVS